MPCERVYVSSRTNVIDPIQVLYICNVIMGPDEFSY